MSLYSLEEICWGCKHANFHMCCNSFCYCEKEHELDVDGCCGKCEYKEKK